MAQIRYRNGSGGWSNPKAIRTWTGSEWKQRMGYRWTGSQWNPIITYQTYLIKDGVPNGYTFELSGNGNYFNYGTVSGAYKISAQGDSSDGADLFIRSIQTINMTPFNKLYVDYSTFGTINTTSIAGITTPYNSSPWNFVADIYSIAGMVSRVTQSVSVSTLSGSYSFGAYVQCTTDTNIDLSIYNMWLE